MGRHKQAGSRGKRIMHVYGQQCLWAIMRVETTNPIDITKTHSLSQITQWFIIKKREESDEILNLARVYVYLKQISKQTTGMGHAGFGLQVELLKTVNSNTIVITIFIKNLEHGTVTHRLIHQPKIKKEELGSV